MGPSAIRYAGLQKHLEQLGHTVIDGGNINVPTPEEVPDTGRVHRLAAVTNVCQSIYAETIRARQSHEFTLFLGGDHSISIGSISAATHQRNIGVMWLDAHADYNTPEISPSGNVHGMSVAALCGLGAPELVNLGRPGQKIDPVNIVYIGTRDVDIEEGLAVRSSGASIFSMREIDDEGIGRIARQALARLNHLDEIHISLDLDFLDPDEAPGVGTPVPGGLSYREAHLLMEMLAESGKVTSMDVVEVNPILDERNRTAELAVGLTCSLLGKRIL
jgi:arginase